MTFFFWLFNFLAALLWGTYWGAKTSKAYSSTRIHLPRGSALFGNWLFTFIVASWWLTTPESEVAAIGGLIALIVGVTVGVAVGRSTYLIS